MPVFWDLLGFLGPPWLPLRTPGGSLGSPWGSFGAPYGSFACKVVEMHAYKRGQGLNARIQARTDLESVGPVSALRTALAGLLMQSAGIRHFRQHSLHSNYATPNPTRRSHPARWGGAVFNHAARSPQGQVGSDEGRGKEEGELLGALGGLLGVVGEGLGKSLGLLGGSWGVLG